MDNSPNYIIHVISIYSLFPLNATVYFHLISIFFGTDVQRQQAIPVVADAMAFIVGSQELIESFSAWET